MTKFFRFVGWVVLWLLATTPFNWSGLLPLPLRIVAVTLTLLLVGLLITGRCVGPHAPAALVVLGRLRPKTFWFLITAMLAGLVMSGTAKERHEQAAMKKHAREERQLREKREADQEAAEKAAARAASQAAFDKMTAREHLDAARQAMASGYDSKTRYGGDYDAAQHHLDAIVEGSKEYNAAASLEKEIAARKQREVTDNLKLAKEVAKTAREGLAKGIDTLFIKSGIEVSDVRASGRDKDVLVIEYALCGRVFMDRVLTDKVRAQWTSAGFHKVECRGGMETWTWDL
jgi:hypothetical protein